MPWLNADGSLIYCSVSGNGGTDTFYKESLTGFNANGNPQYAAAAVVASVPCSYTWDSMPSAPGRLAHYPPWYAVLSNGMLAVYNQVGQIRGHAPGRDQPRHGLLPMAVHARRRPARRRRQFRHQLPGTAATASWSTARTSSSATTAKAGWERRQSQPVHAIQQRRPVHRRVRQPADERRRRHLVPRLRHGRQLLQPLRRQRQRHDLSLPQRRIPPQPSALASDRRKLDPRECAERGVGIPAVPTGVGATPLATSQVNLSWTAPSGALGGAATGYNVYRGTSPGGENYSSPLNGGTLVSGTSYSDASVSAGTTYYYTVEAVNALGSSAASSEANALTFPAAPTGLSAVPFSITQVNLSWTAPGGAVAGYNVYRGTTPGGENYSSPLNGGTPVSGTSYSDTTAAAGTAYYYTVGAVNATGSSAASSEANALTFPAAPTGLSAVPFSITQVNLSWTAPGGTVAGYNVYRAMTPGGENYSSPLNGGTPVSGTSYSDTTAAAGTTYYYTVEAVNATGSSAASSEANALTYPAAPTGLSAMPFSITQINLSWTAPGGAVAGYNVYRGTTPGGENYAAPLNGGTLVGGTSYSDTTAVAGTAYYYTVKAVNAAGGSAASNEAVAPQMFYWSGGAGTLERRRRRLGQRRRPGRRLEQRQHRRLQRAKRRRSRDLRDRQPPGNRL